MASATAVAPPATDPDYRKALEPAGAPKTAANESITEASAPAASAPAAGAPAVTPASGRSRRVSVILHGKRADETDVRNAVQTLRGEGMHVDVKVTWESGDVEKFVQDIVRAHSADTIVAAGGDGTLNEVVAALIKVRAPRNIAVGLMPMGTSNDFAAVTGIPEDLEGALRECCRSDNLRPLDVGLVNGEVFMNTATLGASSELGSETSHEAKKMLGPAAYLVQGFSRFAGYTAVPVRLRFPAPEPSPAAPARDLGSASAAGSGKSSGSSVAPEEQQPQQQPQPQPQHEGKKGRKAHKGGSKTMELVEPVLNLTACNNRQVASMVQPCPDALLDDGLLDITYVTGGAVEGATTLMGEILSRGLDEALPSNVRMLRVPWLEVTVEADDPAVAWPGNRDGEPVPPGRRFLLEALPRRITMHLPDCCRALLTEGADPHLNAPVISINRLRKGVFKAMLAQVRRFRRIIPGSRPRWQGAALGVLGRLPTLLLGFAAGYAVARRGSRSRDEDAGQVAAEEAKDQGRGTGGRRRRTPLPPVWPGGRVRREPSRAAV